MIEKIRSNEIEGCSNHSIERAKERAGLNKKNAIKRIALAKERGLRSENCTWSDDKKFLMKRSDNNVEAIAYNGYCYILNRKTNICVTMYALPNDFGKKKTHYQKGKTKSKDYSLEWAI